MLLSLLPAPAAPAAAAAAVDDRLHTCNNRLCPINDQVHSVAARDRRNESICLFTHFTSIMLQTKSIQMQMPMANCLATLATLAASQKRVAYLCARASKRAERTFASKRQLLSECAEGRSLEKSRGPLIQLLTVSILMRLSSVLHKKRQENCEKKMKTSKTGSEHPRSFLC